MRLKKLTVQAFGPFKDKVIIDFEKENINKGLLLITGDTGAGKTTIFDAVCYALYGETSGVTRTANSLRSDWASPDIETFVELEFYYKGKSYTVRRTPEYYRSKKSGEGKTKQVATAEINIDGRTVTKLNDVTSEIEQLIGLDSGQFRQVAMLSQGEFSKFLLAKSEEKTTIFRKIFGTEFFEILQNKLKSNMLIKKEEIEKIRDKIDTEKKNIESIIDVFSLNNVETIETLNNRIKDDEKNVLELKKDRDTKNELKTKLSTEITNINKLNKDILEYKNANEKLKNILDSNTNIKEEKEKYDYNIKVGSLITNILSKLDSDTKSLDLKQEKLELDKKELLSKKELYKNKENQFNKLDNYSKNIEKITNEINELINKNKDYDNYLVKSNELDNLQESYKDLTITYENKNLEYEKIRKEYYLNISVEIADSLHDGEECPVCGSKEHPHIATSTDNKYTKEDIEKLEKEVKAADNNRKKAEASIEQIRKNLDDFNISKEINIVEEKEKIKKMLDEKIKEKDNINNEFKILSDEKNKLLSDIKSLEDNIKIFEEDIKNYLSNIKENNDLLNKIYIDNDTNLDDYNTKKLNNTELSLLKDKLDNYDKEKNRLESIIKLLENEVKDKDIVDVTKLEENLTDITLEYDLLDENYTKSNALLEKLKSSTKNIEVYIKDNKKCQNEYDVIKLLSDTANGSLTGKVRITFENYVQSYFMKSVLVEANKRLVRMTDSRYELKRKETETKLNVKTGLDFAIFDSYTGKERDVTSLSGGEKFKCSLALALGLSDVISNNRGGIKIDSLFIDEGFGSLDSESLNQALNILTDLSGNDKLVGVISHVSELMSRIDNKIVVNKTNTGSIINIESSK